MSASFALSKPLSLCALASLLESCEDALPLVTAVQESSALDLASSPALRRHTPRRSTMALRQSHRQSRAFSGLSDGTAELTELVTRK